jgi:hypothetical protein
MSATWTTRDGEEILISEMTDDHLRNAIRRCTQIWLASRENISFPNFSGEMAQYYAERDYNALQESVDPSVIFPEYEDLVEEALRRKLDID